MFWEAGATLWVALCLLGAASWCLPSGSVLHVVFCLPALQHLLCIQSRLLLSLGLASHLIPAACSRVTQSRPPFWCPPSSTSRGVRPTPESSPIIWTRSWNVFLPGDWILVSHFPASPWQLWPAVRSFSNIHIQTMPYHWIETFFLRTLEFARSFGNCTIALQTILTVASPCQPINLFHLCPDSAASSLLLRCDAEVPRCLTWEGTWEVSTLIIPRQTSNRGQRLSQHPLSSKGLCISKNV